MRKKVMTSSQMGSRTRPDGQLDDASVSGSNSPISADTKQAAVEAEP
jgi:hypothetical protein